MSLLIHRHHCCALAVATLLGSTVLANAQMTEPDAEASRRFTSIASFSVPQHPFMAPNDRSNIHNDAYMTDAYSGTTGPTVPPVNGRLLPIGRICASVAFDQSQRLVAACLGLGTPRLYVIEPRSLAILAQLDLPEAPSSGDGDVLNFGGGGYFYLDHRNRAVIPTRTNHIWIVEQRRARNPAQPLRLERVADYDLTPFVSPDESFITSAIPDWSGRIWFVSGSGVVGVISLNGTIRTLRLPADEAIDNSLSVDETGGVYIVSTKALYRFDAERDGTPHITWREVYDNIGTLKPGQVSAGSGTTPTLMGTEWVAIADNADPMQVVVYRRAATVDAPRLFCKVPVFPVGLGATENSLIAAGSSLIVENNYGYTLENVQNGILSEPGVARIDIHPDGQCQKVWETHEVRIPSVVSKIALQNGLIYTYTNAIDATGAIAWSLTAVDFYSGEVVFNRMTGRGAIPLNNHYAGLYIGPDRTIYVPTFAGLVALFGVSPRP